MNEDSNFGNIPSHDHSFSDSHDYLSRAQYAVESGDRILGIHLYLAAFEQSILENIVPSEESVNGMRAAWGILPSMHANTRLPNISSRSSSPSFRPRSFRARPIQLQDVALDRLEEFGFSREAIEDMAEMINDDLFNLPPDLLYRYEDDNVPSPFSFLDLSSKRDSASDESDAAPTAETSDRAEEVKAEPIEPEQKEANSKAETDEEPLELPAFPLPNLKGAKIAHIDLSGKKKKKKKAPEIRFDYSTIHGFSRAIEEMKRLGVGRMRDPQFKEFVKMLNFRHGVSRMPQLGTLVFSGAAREDANYFMVATVGELGIPAVRMRMDQNIQGQSVLCVMASPDAITDSTSLNRFGFEGPTALILEDLDLWDLPWMGFRVGRYFRFSSDAAFAWRARGDGVHPASDREPRSDRARFCVESRCARYVLRPDARTLPLGRTRLSQRRRAQGYLASCAGGASFNARA